MTSILYTPEFMNIDHLRTEMILSSLLQPHSTGKTYTITATDGSILYTYKADSYGKIMTGKVISLQRPSEKLTILDLGGLEIDKKHLDYFKEFIIMPRTKKMPPIAPPVHIYKHASECKVIPKLYLQESPNYEAVAECCMNDDEEAIKWLEVVKTSTVTDPIWWAILYRCFLSAKYVAWMHSIELGSVNNIYIIETPGNHFYYSVGHPNDENSVQYDPQEPVFNKHGLTSHMLPEDYEIMNITPLVDFTHAS